ncbi:MAG: beta-lactamase family protein [Bacilli bacterium]|nr:beta-lactamase family protein [Bacilli bacterium]
MFEKITPEQAGFNSKELTKLIKRLNGAGLNTHGILMMKGDKVFLETYYKPFDVSFNHRLYSETKSFVGIAIGLLEEEGKLCLDDPIIKYFPECIDFEPHPYLANQTIKDMLMMKTSVRVPYWFFNEDNDRLHLYFHTKPFRPSGTVWEYDSDGSEVLCCLVEKLTGKTLLEYLKEKMFDDMGVFKNAQLLKVPGGYSWGDSGMIATLRDNAAFARLVMNYGEYNGKRYINEKYVKTATSRLTDNITNYDDKNKSFGYGYQIWHYEDNVFGFVGMGDQLAIMFKDYDVIFMIHSSNQGNNYSRPFIYFNVKELVYGMSKNPLPENKEDYDELQKFCDSQIIKHLPVGVETSLESKINDVVYKCEPNENMNIKEFSLHLEKDFGVFKYINLTGEKEIRFGRGYNKFETFPEEGYSYLVGKEKSKGYFYKCANSGCWRDESKFEIDVEIIDLYFGNLTIMFYFKDDTCFVKMVKNAENFFREYWGELLAFKK